MNTELRVFEFVEIVKNKLEYFKFENRPDIKKTYNEWFEIFNNRNIVLNSPIEVNNITDKDLCRACEELLFRNDYLNKL